MIFWPFSSQTPQSVSHPLSSLHQPPPIFELSIQLFKNFLVRILHVELVIVPVNLLIIKHDFFSFVQLEFCFLILFYSRFFYSSFEPTHCWYYFIIESVFSFLKYIKEKRAMKNRRWKIRPLRQLRPSCPKKTKQLSLLVFIFIQIFHSVYFYEICEFFLL